MSSREFLAMKRDAVTQEPPRSPYPAWLLRLCDVPLLKSISYGHGTFCRGRGQSGLIRHQ